jgi:hypothetical protein
MVGMLSSSVVDPRFKPRLGQNEDKKIGICCFSTKTCSIKETEQRLVGSES